MSTQPHIVPRQRSGNPRRGTRTGWKTPNARHESSSITFPEALTAPAGFADIDKADATISALNIGAPNATPAQINAGPLKVGRGLPDQRHHPDDPGHLRHPVSAGHPGRQPGDLTSGLPSDCFRYIVSMSEQYGRRPT
ncbi:hypothetical protein [Amycolatopsis sp. 3B14]|uniref:hypothetical protein n=1 Tax=Amycolatopsis sp. 3B14 TaxID=3243600 RepID=UPI003D98BE3B